MYFKAIAFSLLMHKILHSIRKRSQYHEMSWHVSAPRAAEGFGNDFQLVSDVSVSDITFVDDSAFPAIMSADKLLEILRLLLSVACILFS